MKHPPHTPTLADIEQLRGAHRDSQPPPPESRPQRNPVHDRPGSGRVKRDKLKIKLPIWEE